MTDDRRPRGSRPSELSDAPTGQLRPLPNLTVEVGGHTDKGRVRPGNEDSFAVEPPTSARARAQGTLLLVSDGMGGHKAGEVASKLAVETIQTAFYRSRGVPVGEALRDAITRANDAIYANAERDPSHSGMGCTVVALVVQSGGLTVGHVGDSRAYLIRNGQAHQLTRDHSWVAMQVAEGILTPEQAEHHPNRSVLMRALGRHATVEIDIGFERLQPGDVLVVCSDGLTGVVDDDEIAAFAGRHAPAALADQLVDLANQRGAPDNVTVVAAAIAGSAVAGDASTTSVQLPDADTTSILPQIEVPTARGIPPLNDAPTVREAHQPAGPDGRTGRPAGTPIVVSRTSAPAPGTRRDAGSLGRGRLVAGSLAALGLAGALALLTLLIRTDAPVQPSAGRPAEAPAAAAPQASVPTVVAPTPVAPAATVTVPPPVPTGLPNVALPGAGSAATPTTVPAQQPAVAGTPVAAAPGVAGQPAATPTGVAGVASAIGSGLATQVPTIVASPPALTLPPVAPTATPAPAQRSEAAPEGAPEGGAAAEQESAPESGAADASAMAPDAAPEGGETEISESEAAAPDEPAPDEPSAQEPPPPPAQTPRAQNSRVGPGGITIPNIPGFRPGRRDDD